MSETRQTYKVIKPIGHAGTRFEIGEAIQLTAAEAANIGDEYVALEPVNAATAAPINEVVGEAPVKAKVRKPRKGNK